MTILIFLIVYAAVGFGWIEIRHRVVSRREEREHQARMAEIDREHRARMADMARQFRARISEFRKKAV